MTPPLQGGGPQFEPGRAHLILKRFIKKYLNKLNDYKMEMLKKEMLKLNKWGLLSLIFGIAGFILILFPYVGIAFSIAAIIFYAMQRRTIITAIANIGFVLGVAGLFINGLLIFESIIGQQMNDGGLIDEQNQEINNTIIMDKERSPETPYLPSYNEIKERANAFYEENKEEEFFDKYRFTSSIDDSKKAELIIETPLTRTMELALEKLEANEEMSMEEFEQALEPKFGFLGHATIETSEDIDTSNISVEIIYGNGNECSAMVQEVEKSNLDQNYVVSAEILAGCFPEAYKEDVIVTLKAGNDQYRFEVPLKDLN
ncbi:MAG: hypothetical protein PWQ28_762 [Candidatus Woesearchaeota archaeon]|nr:hypothetical protein [Candidatus Woesearchaeota archaeon]